MKALITDHPFVSLDIAKEVFASKGIDMVDLQATDAETIIANAQDADALLIGKLTIGEDVLSRLPQCKYIVRFGTGYNNIDIKAATANGIPVANVPDFCMEEVSDHALALIMAAGRQIIVGYQMVQNCRWRPMTYGMNSIYSMRGRVVGLYSYGRIAKLVAKKAQALGLPCIACDPFVPKEIMSQSGVKKVDFETLLKESDYISLHSPLTEETADAFDIEAFKTMKPSSWIINTSPRRHHKTGRPRHRAGRQNHCRRCSGCAG